MATEEETNIISDDDFLREILGQVKQEEPKKEEPSEIEKILSQQDIQDKGDDSGKQKVEEQSEKQEGEAEPKEEVEPEKKVINRFGVKETISTLIEKGMWDDMPIKYGDKEYENIEELIEKEKPSKELFELLSVAQKNYKDNQINETYVKVGDKTSTKAKLIDAIMNDVDYEDLLRNNAEVIEPLQKIDFSIVKGGDRMAEEFVRQCLIEIDNYHPDSINAVVENLKKNHQIIDKAEHYQKLTIESFNEEIENRKIQKQAEISENIEKEKISVKSMKEVLKSQNVADNLASKILKLRFTKDPESNKYHYEELILDRIKDKEFEAKLMYFLLDDKDFITKEKAKVKTETAKNYLELVNAAPKSQSAQASKKSGNLQTDDEDFLREIGLLTD